MARLHAPKMDEVIALTDSHCCFFDCKMEFEYSLTKQFIDETFVETGIKKNARQVVECDTETLSKKARLAIVKNGPATKWPSFCTSNTLLEPEDINGILERKMESHEKCMANISAMINDQLEELKAKDFNHLYEPSLVGKYGYDKGLIKSKNRIADYMTNAQRIELNVIQKEWKAKKEEFTKEQRIEKENKERLAEEKKDVEASERAKWIEEYGDEKLKLALKHTYKCQEDYVTQRASIEYPGFCVDYRDNAEWNERPSPTMEALTILDAIIDSGTEAEIKWVTKRHDESEYDESDPSEGIVIREYLGKYDLIKYLDR